ncbi:uncharacterized protein LOC107867885 [Capsicum annuum]|uniref:uncharacterized protein LOC107867885 n=1 Tax=Capsicum annuum TaxID=4072 RepID=UPI001FB052A0|nr:uncharacterized protein LOC107867885 [Capsicum annuum]
MGRSCCCYLDLLVAVANSSALQYTTYQSKHFREAIFIYQRVEENEQILISSTLRSSSESTSSQTLAPIKDEVKTFLVEGQISLPDRPQFFYLLACSHCNHFVPL